MDTRSVGLILKGFGRGQRDLVERCEREILLSITSLGGAQQQRSCRPSGNCRAHRLKSLWVRKTRCHGFSTLRRTARRPARCSRNSSLHYWWDRLYALPSVKFKLSMQPAVILRSLRVNEYEQWCISGSYANCARCRSTRAGISFMGTLLGLPHGKKSVLRPSGDIPL